MSTKRRKAFSLMEMMIVVIILGLLAGLVLPNLLNKGEEAKSKLVCVQMKSLENSLKMFKVDNGTYPTTEESLSALLTNPDPQKYQNYANGGYLDSKSLPKDSYNSEFIYISEDSDSFDIISLGSDKQEGGEGSAKDIRASECR
jgi:general secretion pathway protein G